jgi:hypothetical protein
MAYYCMNFHCLSPVVPDYEPFFVARKGPSFFTLFYILFWDDGLRPGTYVRFLLFYIVYSRFLGPE